MSDFPGLLSDFPGCRSSVRPYVEPPEIREHAFPPTVATRLQVTALASPDCCRSKRRVQSARRRTSLMEENDVCRPFPAVRGALPRRLFRRPRPHPESPLILPRRLLLLVLPLLLAAHGCREAKAPIGLTAPDRAHRGVSREDSLAQGYFNSLPTASSASAATTSTDTCGTECLLLVSAQPSLSQGYSQPNTIVLTLAGPVGRITVVGQGAIQCSGQYGDLIGYDSTGVEIGRTSLQLIDPADCSPSWNPDNVTYGAQATLITEATMARAEITPMSPLEFTVNGNCCGRASATYSVDLGETPKLPIDLTCTGPFDRGVSITCTATSPNSSQVLKATAWSFVTAQGFRINRTFEQTQLTWSGALVTDGDVVVQGTIDGRPAESQPRRVTAKARDWTTKMPQLVHSGLPTSTMNSRPTAFKDQMGRNKEQTFATPTEGNSIIISDWGPNHQLTYLSEMPLTVQTNPEVNLNALNDTSGFYRIQEPRQRKIGTVTYCAQSYVPTIIEPIRKHEGYNLELKSHARIFQDTAVARARISFEAAVAPPGQNVVSAPLDVVQSAAHAVSQMVDVEGSPLYNPVPLICDFHYDYKGLKP